MKRVLVTGANGFIGQKLCKILSNEYIVRAVSRNIDSKSIQSAYEYVSIIDINPNTCWIEALMNVDIVVHLAARVHVMNDKVKDPLGEFRKVNLHGTMNLAKQAVDAGVKRFIYISSIKVNGESSLNGVFNESDLPLPVDPYGISKYEAESGLFQLAEDTGMEVVCIRPPLVYGPGVKANFHNLMKWLKRGVPLPFGSIHNKRSLVSLDNLLDLILTCLEHPAAKNQVFLVSDGVDLSTTELFERVSFALRKKSRLLPVNEKKLVSFLNFMGKKDLALRLCGSLQVDISKAKKLLDWTPPISVDDGLRQTAQYFLNNIKK